MTERQAELGHMRLAVGQPVTWWWTAGGGGGSGKRKNPKEARHAVVVKIGPRRVKLWVLDRSEGWNETWVDPKNIGPALDRSEGWNETWVDPKNIGPARPDVRVEYSGSVVMVRPLTQRAQDWVTREVALESWQWLGGAFACEPRMVEGLVAGMRDDGLAIEEG